VAALRGLTRSSLDERVADPVARDLVPQPYALAIDLTDRFPEVWNRLRTVADRASFYHFSHVAMRTRAIDDVVTRAIREGAHQLVVLGAGLDSRAWRLSCLADHVVFEVDHPATQAYKRRKIEGRRSVARDVRFVAVDFERDALEERLTDAGYDPTVRSVFIWEGVTMYLQPEAVEQTLSVLSKLAARGSTLLVTYARRHQRSASVEIVRWVVRSSGEPFRALYTRGQMAEALSRHGFRAVTDEGLKDWVPRYRNGTESPGSLERLVHAIRE